MPRKLRFTRPKKGSKKSAQVGNVGEAMVPHSTASQGRLSPDRVTSKLPSQSKKFKNTTAYDNKDVCEKMETFIKGINRDDATAAGPSVVRSDSFGAADVQSKDENTHSILRPEEPVFDIDNSFEEDENVLEQPLLENVEVREMEQIPVAVLEQERLHRMEEARMRAEQEVRLVEEGIERHRQRSNQIPTYLLATTINDNVEQYTLGPFNQESS